MNETMMARARAMLARRVDSGDAALLDSLLAEAADALAALTRRTSLPDGMAGLTARLAAAYYNRLGMEGESERREGSVVSRMDALPEDIAREARAWRLAGVKVCGV